MSARAVGQLELFASADGADYADTLCICSHYGIEHDALGICQARDLFDDDCGCFGYEPDPDHQDGDE